MRQTVKSSPHTTLPRATRIKGNLEIRVVTDADEFRSLREPWDSLLVKSSDNNAYLTWEWLFTWWQHYGKGKKLNILVIGDGEQPIGIIPLMQASYGKPPFRIDVLENIGAMDPDYSGAILPERQDECLAVFLSYLEENLGYSAFRMSRLIEGSEFLTALQELSPLARSLSMRLKTMTTSPYIPLPATWDDYLKSLGSKTRNTLYRKLKKLREEHVVEYQRYRPGGALRDKIQYLFKLQQMAWQSRGLSGSFTDTAMSEFNTDIARLFSEKGWLSLSFITVDGEVASAVYGFDYTDVFYCGPTGFHPDYAKYSLGHLHILSLIEEAIKTGRKEFDFLIGAEEDKYRWQALDRRNLQIIMTKKGLSDMLQPKLLDILTAVDRVKRHGLRDLVRLYLRKREQERRKEERQSEI
jgi:CelD/BcsL family acetyltransferase involved in cellulose biosynthesis